MLQLRVLMTLQQGKGGKAHTTCIEPQISPSAPVNFTNTGMPYFIEQYIKFVAFVGGTGLHEVDQAIAKMEPAGTSAG